MFTLLHQASCANRCTMPLLHHVSWKHFCGIPVVPNGAPWQLYTLLLDDSYLCHCTTVAVVSTNPTKMHCTKAVIQTAVQTAIIRHLKVLTGLFLFTHRLHSHTPQPPPNCRQDILSFQSATPYMASHHGTVTTTHSYHYTLLSLHTATTTLHTASNTHSFHLTHLPLHTATTTHSYH